MYFKKIFLSLITLSLLPFLGVAQQFEISEVDFEYKKETRPAVEIMLESDSKAVKKAWKDFIKDNFDVSLDGFGFLTNKDLLEAKEVTFKAIADNPIDFYTHFTERDDFIKMRIFAAYSSGVYISDRNSSASFNAMKQIAKEFVRKYLPDYQQDQVSEIEEAVEELESDIEDLEKDIADNEEKIKELREENKNLLEELENKRGKLQSVMSTLRKERDELQKVRKEVRNINNEKK